MKKRTRPLCLWLRLFFSFFFFFVAKSNATPPNSSKLRSISWHIHATVFFRAIFMILPSYEYTVLKFYQKMGMIIYYVQVISHLILEIMDIGI